MSLRGKAVTSVLCCPLLVRMCPFSSDIEQHPKSKKKKTLHYQPWTCNILTNVRNVVTHLVQVLVWVHIPELLGRKQKPLICLKLAPSERNSLLVPALSHWTVCSCCLSCQREGCPHICGMVNQWESESIIVEGQWSPVYTLDHHVAWLVEVCRRNWDRCQTFRISNTCISDWKNEISQ